MKRCVALLGKGCEWRAEELAKAYPEHALLWSIGEAERRKVRQVAGLETILGGYSPDPVDDDIPF